MNSDATYISWERLKKLYESKYLSVTIVFPILTTVLYYLFEALGIVLDKDVLSKLISEHGNDFRLFYLGLFIIAISSIIFKIFCPSIILDNVNINDFIEKECKIYSNDKKIKYFNFLIKNNVEIQGSPESTDYNIILSAYYNYFLSRLIILRYILGILFLLGFTWCSFGVLRKSVVVLWKLF